MNDSDIKTKLKGEVMLALAAIIWGTAFIFQKMGMDHIGPMTFTMFRFGMGALAMIPVMMFSDMTKKKKDISIVSCSNRTLIIGGILVGAANFAASALQQIGIVYTTAGKAGFLTAMDMVMVPFFLVLLRRKVHGLTWFGVVVAAIGMYLLCMKGGSSIAIGDLFCLGGACGFAIQILIIDYFVEKVDPIKLAFYEFAVTAILSLVFTLIFEEVVMADVIACAGPLLYTAILEVCIAFSLQMIGQQYAPPAIATIIMSFESVFAALSGALFLHEVMSGRELAGCIIMFCAFMIAQIPEMREEN